MPSPVICKSTHPEGSVSKSSVDCLPVAISGPQMGGPFAVRTLDRADLGAQACQPTSASVEGYGDSG